MCGWEHTLDCLYDSLSSPPVAGVWWEHTLDWLYDSLSSPPVAGVWWEHTIDWLYVSLSSPPVAGVWWAHTLDWLHDYHKSGCCTLVVVEERPPPHIIVKCFGCTTRHNKALYKCIIHSFHCEWNSSTKCWRNIWRLQETQNIQQRRNKQYPLRGKINVFI